MESKLEENHDNLSNPSKNPLSEKDIFLFVKLHKRRNELKKAFVKGSKIYFNSVFLENMQIEYKSLLQPIKQTILKEFPLKNQDCFNIYYRIDPVISDYSRKMSTDKKTNNIEFYSKTESFLYENKGLFLEFKEIMQIFWHICLLIFEKKFEGNTETKLLAEKNLGMKNSLKKQILITLRNFLKDFIILYIMFLRC